MLYSVVLSAQTKQYSKPFDFPVLLSGNFGELRSNHFHAGLDFKTQGVVGKPLHAPADGYIMRVTVSPGGYGRALYVRHDDGFVTVYGHLDRFLPDIAAKVRQKQYDDEVFAVDMNFEPDEFPVRRGEVIAYSGNSGYSFGPHLHFEIRRADTDELLNPLQFYKADVVDTKPPVAHAVAVEPLRGCGIVDSGKSAVTRKFAAGQINDTITAWGSIGFSIKADDYMDNTRNRYGVYSIKLFVDDSLRFESRMDKYPRKDTRQINAWVDYERYYNDKEWFLRSYILENNTLPMLKADEARGWVTVDEERLYKVEYHLADYHGNVSRYRFAIEGRRDTIPEENIVGCYLYWYLNNEIEREGMRLSIPHGQLFENAMLDVCEESGDDSLSLRYNLGGVAYPLRNKCTLSLRLLKQQEFPSEKYYMRRITDKGTSAHVGKLEDGWLTADITVLGCYDIALDTLPPIIKPVNEKNWSKNGCVVFALKDDAVGIEGYKCLIDGHFVLSEFSSKNGRLTCNLKREGVARGKHTLELRVTDRAGNENVIKKDIIY